MHYSFYTYSNSHTCIFLINCLFKNVQKQKRKKTQTSQIKSEACAISLWQYLEDMVLGSVVSNSFCDICHRFVRPGLAVVVVFWGGGQSFLPPCATEISNFHAAQCPNCAPFVEEQSYALLETKKIFIILKKKIVLFFFVDLFFTAG